MDYVCAVATFVDLITRPGVGRILYGMTQFFVQTKMLNRNSTFQHALPF